MSELKYLKEALEKQVNLANSDKKSLFDLSKKIDNTVVNDYIIKTYITAFRKQYGEYLERTDILEITNIIKEDIIEIYPHISDIELEMFSSNIYDYCCLLANNISEQQIIDYIMDKNRLFYNFQSNEDYDNTYGMYLNKFNTLKKKYISVFNKKN